jgi:hypothetical protein
MTWLRLARIAFFAALVFAVCNGVFLLAAWAAWNTDAPLLDRLGAVSLYGTLFPYRERLSASEDPAREHSLNTANIPALLASHALSGPKAADEYRVVVFGDSGTRGWLYSRAQTVTARLNAAGLTVEDGRRLVFYNTAYPRASITTQLMLLDAIAACCQPDAVVAFVSPFALWRSYDDSALLLPGNAHRLHRLAAEHALDLPESTIPPFDPAAHTIVGSRAALAELLRLQTYGASWAATGIDQYVPEPLTFTPVSRDLEARTDWEGTPEAGFAWETALRFDVLRALHDEADAAGGRVFVVMSPTFRADGANRDLRYSVWYPRWAFDGVRARLLAESERQGWAYRDLWDLVPPEHFTDSPAHFDAEGARLLADALTDWLRTSVGGG